MWKDISEIYNEGKAFAKTRRFLDVIQTLKEAVSSIDISKPLEEVEQKAYGMLGNAYIKTKQPKAAIALLKPLHESGRGNTVTTNTLGNAYLHDGQPKAAIALLTPLHDSGRGNTVTTNTLGNAYLHDGQPKAAIALLKPLHDSGRGDTVTAATLGNAYLHDGQPKAAIALLKPLHESGRGDTVTATTLGNAYAIDKNQKGFDSIKASISPVTMRDYLQAKLFYLNNQSGGALKVLKPYIIEAKNIRDVPTSIMGTYLSCLGDNSPMFDHLRASAGEEYFSFLMMRRDSWRADPTRAELANDFMFSSQTLWELGGTPASAQDRDGLGLTPAQGALVAVRHTPNLA